MIGITSIYTLENLGGDALISAVSVLYQQRHNTQPPAELLSCNVPEKLLDTIQAILKSADLHNSATKVGTSEHGRLFTDTFFCFDINQNFICLGDDLDDSRYKIVFPDTVEIQLRNSDISHSYCDRVKLLFQVSRCAGQPVDSSLELSWPYLVTAQILSAARFFGVFTSDITKDYTLAQERNNISSFLGMRCATSKVFLSVACDSSRFSSACFRFRFANILSCEEFVVLPDRGTLDPAFNKESSTSKDIDKPMDSTHHVSEAKVTPDDLDISIHPPNFSTLLLIPESQHTTSLPSAPETIVTCDLSSIRSNVFVPVSHCGSDLHIIKGDNHHPESTSTSTLQNIVVTISNTASNSQSHSALDVSRHVQALSEIDRHIESVRNGSFSSSDCPVPISSPSTFASHQHSIRIKMDIASIVTVEGANYNQLEKLILHYSKSKARTLHPTVISGMTSGQRLDQLRNMLQRLSGFKKLIEKYCNETAGKTRKKALRFCFAKNGAFCCVADGLSQSTHKFVLPECLERVLETQQVTTSFRDRALLLEQLSRASNLSADRLVLSWSSLCVSQMLSVAKLLGVAVNTKVLFSQDDIGVRTMLRQLCASSQRFMEKYHSIDRFNQCRFVFLDSSLVTIQKIIVPEPETPQLDLQDTPPQGKEARTNCVTYARLITKLTVKEFASFRKTSSRGSKWTDLTVFQSSTEYKELLKLYQTYSGYDEVIFCFDAQSEYVCMLHELRIHQHSINLTSNTLRKYSISGSSLTPMDRVKILYQLALAETNFNVLNLVWQGLTTSQMVAIFCENCSDCPMPVMDGKGDSEVATQLGAMIRRGKAFKAQFGQARRFDFGVFGFSVEEPLDCTWSVVENSETTTDSARVKQLINVWKLQPHTHSCTQKLFPNTTDGSLTSATEEATIEENSRGKEEKPESVEYNGDADAGLVYAVDNGDRSDKVVSVERKSKTHNKEITLRSVECKNAAESDHRPADSLKVNIADHGLKEEGIEDIIVHTEDAAALLQKEPPVGKRSAGPSHEAVSHDHAPTSLEQSSISEASIAKETKSDDEESYDESEVLVNLPFEIAVDTSDFLIDIVRKESVESMIKFKGEKSICKTCSKECTEKQILTCALCKLNVHYTCYPMATTSQSTVNDVDGTQNMLPQNIGHVNKFPQLKWFCRDCYLIDTKDLLNILSVTLRKSFSNGVIGEGTRETLRLDKESSLSSWQLSGVSSQPLPLSEDETYMSAVSSRGEICLTPVCHPEIASVKDNFIHTPVIKTSTPFGRSALSRASKQCKGSLKDDIVQAVREAIKEELISVPTHSKDADTQTPSNSPDALYSEMLTSGGETKGQKSMNVPHIQMLPQSLPQENSRSSAAKSPPQRNIDPKCSVIIRNVQSRKFIKTFGEIKKEFTKHYPLTKVVYSHPTSGGALIIGFENHSDAEKVEKGWKPYFFTGFKTEADMMSYEKTSCIISHNLKTKALLKGIPITVKDSTITKVTQEKFPGSEAKRFVTRAGKKLETVMVTFQTPGELEAALLDTLAIENCIYSLEEYVQKRKVIQCYHCNKFGHVSKWCRSKKSCVYCGNSHDSRDCLEQHSPRKWRCSNCSGNHAADDEGCPTYREKIAQLNSSNNRYE